MNFNNFTIKSQEAVQEAVNLVQSRGQQAIEPVHIMQGVMKVGENVTNFIFQKLGMNGQQVALVVDRQIDSLPTRFYRKRHSIPKKWVTNSSHWNISYSHC